MFLPGKHRIIDYDKYSREIREIPRTAAASGNSSENKLNTLNLASSASSWEPNKISMINNQYNIRIKCLRKYVIVIFRIFGCCNEKGSRQLGNLDFSREFAGYHRAKLGWFGKVRTFCIRYRSLSLLLCLVGFVVWHWLGLYVRTKGNEVRFECDCSMYFFQRDCFSHKLQLNGPKLQLYNAFVDYLCCRLHTCDSDRDH